jgi:hypothetical protein
VGKRLSLDGDHALLAHQPRGAHWIPAHNQTARWSGDIRILLRRLLLNNLYSLPRSLFSVWLEQAPAA